MFEIYLWLVDRLVDVVRHYNRIHYFYYSIFVRDRVPFEEFDLNPVNVFLYIVSFASIAMCIGLLFIPIKGTSGNLRRERIWIRRLAPIGIILSPTPMMLWAGYQIYLMGTGLKRFIQRIIHEYSLK